MKKYSIMVQRCVCLISWLGVLGTIATLLPDRALAQIVPDASLGAENSVVTPNTIIRGLPNDRIDGGAIRGSNLFHSFQQFNIGEGRGAYFSNPAGIENILSRVTGNGRSEILGRLGVLGNANLFLLNPNGIVFGPNSSLDVEGSFTATTANAIALGDQGFFSATQPENSNLLAIAPGALFFDQQVRQPRTIQNSGNLTAGRDLTLAADNLELQGQVRSGGNLTLHAQDTLRIRDSVTSPFIAAAGGNLLVQGDRAVDIFALNHPNSGLFSGGDMVLRSANTVGGDAHYYSGGNFQIERPDGSLGDLYSPYDPIIRSLGNVSFDAYVGTSLHILAAGSVTVPGFIQITGADPTDGLVDGSVELSRGFTAIDGRGEPTLDVRAGLEPAAVVSTGIEGFGTFFNPLPNLGVPTLTNPPVSRADVNVGAVIFGDIVLGTAAPNFLAGKVLLTNQYRPNLALDGNIQIRDTLTGVPQLAGQLDGVSIRSGSFNGGGSTIIDSRGTISINGVIQNSAIFNPVTNSFTGNGGDVTLLANGDITFNPSLFGFSIFSRGSLSGNTTLHSNKSIIFNNSGILSDTFSTEPGAKSGSINIAASSLSLLNGSQLNTATSGGATAGDINISVSGTLNTAGLGINRISNQVIPNLVGSGVLQGANAQGGNINISANLVSISDFTQISASLFGQGNAGSISIRDADSIILSGNSLISSNVEEGAVGNGGEINIRANSLSIIEGAQVQTIVDDAMGSLSAGQGVAGNITLDVRDNITISNAEVASTLNSGTVGQAGNISIITRTGSLLVSDDALIRASTSGHGNSGNVFIQANGLISLAGNSFVVANVESGGVGDAGNIDIQARTLFIAEGAQVQSLIREASGNLAAGRGNTGDINIDAQDGVTLSGVRNGKSSAIINTINPGASGGEEVGNVSVSARSLSILGGALLRADTLGKGNAGNILIRVSEDIHLQGEGSLGGTLRIPSTISTLTAGASGDGGNIDISAGSLRITNGATLTSSAFGQGNAGNILLNIRGLLQADNGTISTTAARSSGGAIDIVARDIRLRGDSDITTFVGSGAGGGGNITLTAKSIIALDDSDILSFAQDGRGGNITLNTRAFFGQNYRPGDPPPFENNNRVDINASGTISGIITLPDTTFIQNSLAQLSDNLIDPNILLASSCIVRNREQNGTFLVTGSGGLPVRPGDPPPAMFPTGEVRSLPEAGNREQGTENRQSWKLGDPIVEPQGVYRLANGKLVMSRECEHWKP